MTRPDESDRLPAGATDPDAEVVCPSCSRRVRRQDSTLCAICARRVCLACVRPYGHHMRACDDCRVADW
jgi:hypothetical protein